MVKADRVGGGSLHAAPGACTTKCPHAHAHACEAGLEAEAMHEVEQPVSQAPPSDPVPLGGIGVYQYHGAARMAVTCGTRCATRPAGGMLIERIGRKSESPDLMHAWSVREMRLCVRAGWHVPCGMLARSNLEASSWSAL